MQLHNLTLTAINYIEKLFYINWSPAQAFFFHLKQNKNYYESEKGKVLGTVP